MTESGQLLHLELNTGACEASTALPTVRGVACLFSAMVACTALPASAHARVEFEMTNATTAQLSSYFVPKHFSYSGAVTCLENDRDARLGSAHTAAASCPPSAKIVPRELQADVALDAEESRRVIDLLLNPPKPTAALRAAFARRR